MCVCVFYCSITHTMNLKPSVQAFSMLSNKGKKGLNAGAGAVNKVWEGVRL